MKKILLLLTTSATMAGCSYWAYRPAINYNKDQMTAPYKIAINFENGTCDTIDVADFRSCNVWGNDGTIVFQIKKINASNWSPVNNVNYIKILQSAQKPERVKKLNNGSNPHNYQYNYWD